MSYRVEVEDTPARDLRRMPHDLRQRVQAAIDRLSGNPRPRGYVPVQSRSDTLRVRVGDTRVLYKVDDKRQTVTVTDIMRRQADYRP